MYPDNELITCVVCEAKGIFAPNISGVETFFHKIPSPRIQGFFTFTDSHQN